MVVDSPSMVDVKEEIQDIVDRASEYIGYNLSFDLAFLKAAGIRFDPVVRRVDVMHLFAPIWGDYNEYFCEYTWCKLTDMANFYGFEWPKSAHNSLADCFATLFCYQKIIEETKID